MTKDSITMALRSLVHKHSKLVTKYWETTEQMENFVEHQLFEDENCSDLKNRLVKAFQVGPDMLEKEFKKFLDELTPIGISRDHRRAIHNSPNSTYYCEKCGKRGKDPSLICPKCGGRVYSSEELEEMLDGFEAMLTRRAGEDDKSN